MPFLSQNCLETLKNYQYRSCGYSWLDNKMNPFWEWFVKLMPMWLAPNLMTVLGFIPLLILQFILTFFDLSMSQNVPNIIFLCLGFFVFFYQTLDATDGKQARRTKNSSPLGQLVDHGCDSFSTSFLALSIMEMAQIPKDVAIWDMLIIWSVVFSAHWNEKQTKILIHQINNFGVTELQFIIMGCFILTSILGQSFWRQLTLQQIFPFFSLPEIIGSQTCYSLFHIPLVYIIGISAIVLVLFNGFKKTKNRRSAAVSWLPLLTLFIIGYFLCKLPELQDIYALVLLYISIIYSTLTSKFIVCSVAEMEFPQFHIELVYSIVIFIVLQFSGPYLNKQQKVQIFILSFCIILILSFLQIKQMINEICEFLGIQCFRIKKFEDISEKKQKQN